MIPGWFAVALIVGKIEGGWNDAIFFAITLLINILIYLPVFYFLLKFLSET
jgi:hypothetical protein